MFAKFSVKKPLTVFVAVVLVIILGFVSFTNMTPDLLPSINLPYALVITSYPGATPEEVESRVTKPMEKAMASLENISDVSSVSAENMSRVILQFNDNANMDNVVPEIREKINGISGSWDDMVGTPFILKLNPDLLPVTVSAVNYNEMNSVELTSFLNDELLPQLEGVTGVASVSLSGNVEQQINVIISEEKLKAVNDKITRSIDDKFADAEDELNEKAGDIEEGKAELASKSSELDSAKAGLENGKTTLTEQTAGAQSQLIDKKVTVETAKSQINAQITQANENLKLLIESQKQLSDLKGKYDEVSSGIETAEAAAAGLGELQSSYNSLKNQKAEAEAQLEELKKIDPPTEESAKQIQALKAQLTQIEAGIAAAESGIAAYGITPDEIDAKLAELNGTVSSLKDAKAQMDVALSAMGVEPSQLNGKLEEINGNIAKIQGGMAQLSSTLAELESGSQSIDSALAELNKQQISGVMQISEGLSQISVAEGSLASAKGQLDSAEEQIDSARETMKDQKEQAYDSANITITMDMVNQILTAQNFSMPAGYVSDGENDYLVRVGDKIKDAGEMQNLLLFDTGIEGVGGIYLKDVADVFLTDNSAETYAKIDGNDGVMLSFSKQSDYATATVSENINNKYKELSEKYPGLSFVNLSDQGDYIEIVVDSVINNLVLGAILAVLILLLFLKDIKPTAVIACSIPISLLFAIVLMYFSGITLNVISLSGLAIGVGMLVDNSVVVIENIYRMRSEGESTLKAAVYGTVQVTGAIAASTLTTVCVFLPIVFIQGITRQLFTDMALTIAYSLLASLIVAITLVPAMASGVLRKSKEKSHKLFDKFLDGYEKLARVNLRFKWVSIVLSVVLLFGSMYLILDRGFIFMQAMSGQQISVTVSPGEDATFEEAANLADKVMERMMEIEDIETVGGMSSSGLGSMMGGGSSSQGGQSVSIYAIIRDGAKLKDAEISKLITEKCADLGGEITAEGAMDMSSYMSAMSGSGITLTLYGNDLDGLISEAGKVTETLRDIEGVDKVESGIDDATPELRITVNKEAAMKEGLTVAQVFSAVSAEIKENTKSTAITLDGTDVDTMVYSQVNQNRTPDDIRNMSVSVTSKDGEKKDIKLSSIASVSETKSLNSISRDNQKRYLKVSAALKEGYNVTNVTNEVHKVFDGYQPAEGIKVEVGGESTSIMEAVEQLLYMMLLAVVIIYLIMVAQFQSFKSPFIVMFTIPLAFTGGFIALLITGMELSVVSLVGFVMLAGIIVNNGIVLIDYINTLRLSGVEKREAIIRAGRTRMRPILMTALTTVIGLVFMAVGTGMGSEMMQPMAIVCIGGLLYATAMTLFVVPAMYDILSRREMKKIVIDEDDEIIPGGRV